MTGLAVKPDIKVADKPKPIDTDYGDLTVADAGSGAKKIDNPLANLVRNVSQEDYDRATGQTVAGGGGKATDLIAAAKKMVGVPYVWGGTSPLGVDCSGFTQLVFKQFGIDLPRVSFQQGNGGKAVANRDQWAPGDLLFWDNSPRNPGADHVAIYLGNGMMISAPKPGDKVKIQSVYGTPWARRYL